MKTKINRKDAKTQRKTSVYSVSSLRTLCPIFLLILMGYFSLHTGYAQEEITYDQINDVAREMYCPVCPNEPLHTCGTEACIQWREEIRIMLSEGQNKQEIQDNFYARYGSRVLAQPKVEGIGILLWATIPVGFIVGGFFFYRYLQQLKSAAPVPSRTTPKTSPPQPSIDPYIQRIEAELRNRG